MKGAPAPLALVLLLSSLACAPEKPPGFDAEFDSPDLTLLGFSRALGPVHFDPAQHAARSGEKRVADSAGCRSCHVEVYDNWHRSRHRVAFTNELYREAHAREPSNWCVNCHAPFLRPGGRESSIADRVQAEDGISCITCHVRNGQVIAAKTPAIQQEKPAHDYRIIEDFGSEKLCASCHQFNFPTAHSARPGQETVYSALPMQNVVREWRDSSFGGRLNCVHCHVAPNTEESHRFPGGHAITDLAGALSVEAEAFDPQTIRLTVFMIGVGHAFPTGDLFRTLRVHVATAGGQPLAELLLKKSYGPIEGRPDEATPARRLLGDTRLPPPEAGAYFAERSFLIAARPMPDHLSVALYMDYLEPSAHFLTRLPLDKTRPLIKRMRIVVRDAAAAR